MSTDNPTTDLDLIRGIYQAFAARDIHAILATVHPDIEITACPKLPWGGRHHGPEGS